MSFDTKQRRSKHAIDPGGLQRALRIAIYDKRTDTHVCCDTGGGPFARQWCTAKAGLVDFGYLKATGDTRSRWCCRSRRTCRRWSSSGRCRRSPTRSSATAPAPTTRRTRRWSACTAWSGRSKEVRAGRTKSWNDFKVPEEAVSCGFHEAARGVLSHHMVIRDGKIANYQPYPPTPWNASPRDSTGRPGPTRTRCRTRRSSRRTAPTNFKGVDIMRAVRSFDPCLPCGVHMYTGKGKVRKVIHTPTGLC